MNEPSRMRRFRVHARHLDRHHDRVVSEISFEAAAISYVEHLASTVDNASEISVIVRDLDSGHEHCFRVDMSSGATESCM